jgi:hypothetical protein
LLAASSLPVTMVSGWNRDLYLPFLTSSITFGSRSTYSKTRPNVSNHARIFQHHTSPTKKANNTLTYKLLGTCLPFPVSLKNVENPSSE